MCINMLVNFKTMHLIQKMNSTIRNSGFEEDKALKLLHEFYSDSAVDKLMDQFMDFGSSEEKILEKLEEFLNKKQIK